MEQRPRQFKPCGGGAALFRSPRRALLRSRARLELIAVRKISIKRTLAPQDRLPTNQSLAKDKRGGATRGFAYVSLLLEDPQHLIANIAPRPNPLNQSDEKPSASKELENFLAYVQQAASIFDLGDSSHASRIRGLATHLLSALYTYRSRVFALFVIMALRLSAVCTPSGGNSQLWQKPLSQSDVSNDQGDQPYPFRHVSMSPVSRRPFYGGRSSSDTSW